MIRLTFPQFTNDDFDVFAIKGLEARMEAIKSQIQPKFAQIGEIISPFLTAQLGDPVYTHIAKHIRRTVHAPDETWVAWSTNKRGYKAHPHFQLGLRKTHLFAWFALIYECERKKSFAIHFLQNLDKYSKQIPPNFYVSQDHTQPNVTQVAELNQDDWKTMLTRLARVKKAEFLCGLYIPYEEAIQLDGAALQTRVEDTFSKLIPFYSLAFA